MLADRTIFYAVTVPSLVAELLFFYYRTSSFKTALLYTLLTAKIFVVMAIIAGLDTVAFYIITYRKVGDAILVTRKIPITFGWITLFMLALSVFSIYAYEKLLIITPSNIREILEVVNE